MSQTNLSNPRKVLAFASVVEVATGLALMIDPAIVAKLLLGVELAGVGVVLGRCFGIALFTLGWACWPSRERAESDSPPFRGMLTYNALIALYLAWLGTVRHLGGLLLWPAAVVHAAVALLMIWARREASAPFKTEQGG